MNPPTLKASEGFFMQKFDYIIVGLGIAGISLTERLLRKGKRFVVIDNSQHNSTAVAGGVVNPMVLKRLNPVWNASEFLAEAIKFYPEVSQRLPQPISEDIPLLRVMGSVKEQNDWIAASSGPSRSHFLSSELISDHSEGLKAPFGYGKVKKTFHVNTGLLIKDFKKLLKSGDHLLEEEFDYLALEFNEGLVRYQDLLADKIIFAEGASAMKNPFLPPDILIPKKGEYITVQANELSLKSILKGPFFIIPLGDGLFKIGATFAHGDESYGTTEKGRDQLRVATEKVLNCRFKVVDQVAGMRPTVKDRKPIMGRHSELSSVIFFNGLGTRGLLMAPLLSKWMLDHLEDGKPIPSEVNIDRFNKG